MLSIMNAALLAQGFQEVASENDGTEEFLALSRNWPAIVESELEDSRLYFTKEEARLQTRAEGKFGYDDAFMVPAAALHVRNCWVVAADGTRYSPEWVQDGTYVHLNNAAGCTIEYVASAPENLWSANFVRGVQMKLEAVLLRISGEPGDAREMEQQAEVHFQRARTNSSKAKSPRQMIRSSRIANARFGRG